MRSAPRLAAPVVVSPRLTSVRGVARLTARDVGLMDDDAIRVPAAGHRALRRFRLALAARAIGAARASLLQAEDLERRRPTRWRARRAEMLARACEWLTHAARDRDRSRVAFILDEWEKDRARVREDLRRLASGMGCCADKSCTEETCMALPRGTTCGDCAHLARCVKIFGHEPEDTSCDWFPRRFRLAVVAGDAPRSSR